jgi:hypothetical protein
MSLSRAWVGCIFVITFAIPLQASEGGRSFQVKRFYADTSFWNTPIPADASIDPNSDNIVKIAILPYWRRANFTNSRVWGISVSVAKPDDKLYTIACMKYGCGRPVTFSIPPGALPDTGSDHHLVERGFGVRSRFIWLGRLRQTRQPLPGRGGSRIR